MNSLSLKTPEQLEESKHLVDSLASDDDVVVEVLKSRDDGAPFRLSFETSRVLIELLGQLARGNEIQIVGVPEVLTTSEAARQLGVSRPTLMKWVRAGEIPSHKVGTHTKLRRDGVLALKRQKTQERAASLEELMGVSLDIAPQVGGASD